MAFGFATALGLGSLGASLLNGFGSSKSTTVSSSNTSSNSNSVAEGTSTRQYGEQQFNDELLASLEGLLGTEIPGFSKATEASKGRLDQLNEQAQRPAFDVNAFADGITGQAASRANFDLESNLGSLYSSTGTSSADNSMTALLENRLRNDTAANLAGVRAGAVSTGEQIRQAEESRLTAGIQGLSDSLANQVLSLVTQGRGARTAGTTTSEEASTETTKTNTTGTTTSTTKDKKNPFESFSNLFSVLGQSNLAA